MVEFKRKIITSPDKAFAFSTEILLKNPDAKRINWRFDISILGSDKTF